MTIEKRTMRNGVPGKLVKVEEYDRFVPDDYRHHPTKKKR